LFIASSESWLSTSFYPRGVHGFCGQEGGSVVRSTLLYIAEVVIRAKAGIQKRSTLDPGFRRVTERDF
jgi:hypothetical protein